MAKFKIGQKVVCIESVTNNMGVGVTKGTEYAVLGEWECPCGQSIDVGIKSFSHLGCHCSTCGKNQPLPIIFVGSKHFALVEEQAETIRRVKYETVVMPNKVIIEKELLETAIESSTTN